MPRCAGGTVSSPMEKSRTLSSEIWIRPGVYSGLRSPDQPAGASAGSVRSVIRLCVESADRSTEYGSVTDAVTTLPAAGCHAVTRYR
nr:hypothetical protein GCM10020092_041950 [Actinoplanes digitatis]